MDPRRFCIGRLRPVASACTLRLRWSLFLPTQPRGGRAFPSPLPFPHHLLLLPTLAPAAPLGAGLGLICFPSSLELSLSALWPHLRLAARDWGPSHSFLATCYDPFPSSRTDACHSGPSRPTSPSALTAGAWRCASIIIGPFIIWRCAPSPLAGRRRCSAVQLRSYSSLSSPLSSATLRCMVLWLPWNSIRLSFRTFPDPVWSQWR